MDFSIDSLKILIEKVKSVGFFQRLFNWGGIKSLLVDAASDLQRLVSLADTLKELNNTLGNKNLDLEREAKSANETIVRKESEVERLGGHDKASQSKRGQSFSKI